MSHVTSDGTASHATITALLLGNGSRLIPGAVWSTVHHSEAGPSPTKNEVRLDLMGARVQSENLNIPSKRIRSVFSTAEWMKGNVMDYPGWVGKAKSAATVTEQENGELAHVNKGKIAAFHTKPLRRGRADATPQLNPTISKLPT